MITFQPGNSWFYLLHPMTKGAIVMTGILFLSLHGLGWQVSAISLIGILALFWAGAVPFRETIVAVRGIFMLLLFIALANVWQGAPDAPFRVLDSLSRILGVFFLSGLFVTSASQTELMIFWEACFSPLRLFGVSTRELALVLVIAVRFLPVIMGEMERIQMAQRARGACFSGKGLIARIRQLMPLLVPTLVLSIHRAGDLAIAMEARGYRVQGERTRYHTFSFRIADVLVAVCILVIFAKLFLLP